MYEMQFHDHLAWLHGKIRLAESDAETPDDQHASRIALEKGCILLTLEMAARILLQVNSIRPSET